MSSLTHIPTRKSIPFFNSNQKRLLIHYLFRIYKNCKKFKARGKSHKLTFIVVLARSTSIVRLQYIYSVVRLQYKCILHPYFVLYSTVHFIVHVLQYIVHNRFFVLNMYYDSTYTIVRTTAKNASTYYSYDVLRAITSIQS